MIPVELLPECLLARKVISFSTYQLPTTRGGWGPPMAMRLSPLNGYHQVGSETLNQQYTYRIPDNHLSLSHAIMCTALATHSALGAVFTRLSFRHVCSVLQVQPFFSLVTTLQAGLVRCPNIK